MTKTLVSIMIIDYFAPKTKHINGQRPQKILVVESTEQTIDQRINLILSNVDLKGLTLKKEMFAGLDEQQFKEQFERAELLIAASDIATKLFDDGLVKIDEFCLIIFHDIHQNFDNPNNRRIMHHYEQAERKPRILGFCISLINNESTTKRMNALIRKMETNFHSKCKAAICTYNNKPKEIIIRIKPSSLDLVLNNEFRSAFNLLSSLVKFLDRSKIKAKNPETSTIQLKSARKFLHTFIYVIEELGIWPAKKLTELYINELAELASVNIGQDKNYASALSALNSLFNYLRALLNALLKNYSVHDQFYVLSSSKLRCLVSTLSENLAESNRALELLKPEKDRRMTKKIQTAQFSCIIFAKKKEVVRVLATYLNEVSSFDIEGCFGLKSESIVCEKRIAKNFEELKPNKKQEEIITKFKKLEYNTLVITSSIEEMLDIPKCNLVIRFDLPTSSKEYIQSKERTRLENNKLVFIVNEGAGEEEKLLEFVRQEKILMEKFKSNSGELEEERRLRELGVDLEQVEKQIPSFRPKNKKTAREANTSICIAVINRYCSKLPSDSFTKLFPRWKLNEKIDEETGYKLYQCELNLPINSPIRYEIRGDFVLTRKLAKKSAAIKACQKLYECGELDEYLLPICKENIKCIDNEVELIGEEPPDANGRNLAGTTKKRRYYNKKTADILTGESLSANKSYHLYIFTMRLTCPIPEEQNTRGRKIVDPADHPRNFGLLMRNKLPKICKFPVFTRSGEVLVDLKRVPTKTQLNEQEFERLVNFHKFTFKDVLLLEKYPMKFDYANSNSTYLVVPIDYDVKQPDENLAQAKLDWEFISVVEAYQDKLANGGYLKAADLANKNRPKFEFKKELYEDAVIKPLYHKNDLHFYFYVAEIFENLNPLSPFTNDKYETFAEYFQIKYNTELTNLTQPLLDVDYTSARLNLLTPRYVNRKGVTLPMSTAKTKIEIRNNLEKKQLLIPEICILHPFPASFWKKAVCLPSLLYRLNCLLLADELRKEVAISVNIGKIELSEDENWPALDFGWTLADVLKGCSEKAGQAIESLEVPSASPATNSSAATKPKAPANEATGKPAAGGKSTSAKQKQTAAQEKSAAASMLNQPSEPLGDYVIDVFDPTKYEIKDAAEDDDSDDPEMEQDFYKILSGNKMFAPKTTFDLNSMNSQSAFPMEQMFNGSTFSFSHPSGPPGGPLAIENDQPNWTEHNRFLNCGMGGLTSISGLENFNMQSLSEDIAKINEVDDVDLIGNFDSDEDVSSGPEDLVEDEEDAEFDMSYKPKNSFFSKPSYVQDEYMYEIQTNGLMSDNRVADSQQSELTNICNNLKEEELEQDQIVQKIDLSYFEIKSFVENGAEQAAGEQNEQKPPKGNRLKLTEITKMLKDAIGFDEQADSSNKTKSAKSVDKKTNKEQEDKENFQPGFGELLPIKKPAKGDEQKKRSVAKPDEVEKPTFDVKFDPYEDDQKDCLGPDPSMILQAITMSNASDCINLERLETVGDSFLKYAVTAYLYCTYEKIHEGKLSHLRSKQISNYNLFRLGKNKCLGELMVATKFEPSDNWLPPGFVIPKGLEQVLVDLSIQNSANAYDLNALKHLSLDKISESELRQEIEKLKAKCIISSAIKDAGSDDEGGDRGYENAMAQITKKNNTRITDPNSLKDATHIPYNLSTQHSIPDKSIADCVESLIGAYLISCGTKSALLFMKWLGLKVIQENANQDDRGDGRWHWLPKVCVVCGDS